MKWTTAPALLALAILGPLGCGGGQATTSEPGNASAPRENSSASPEASAPVLTIGKAALSAPGATIAIDATGKIAANDKPVGQVHADGRFVDAKGKLLATMSREGTIQSATGETLRDLTVSEDGTLRVAGKVVSIAEDGSITGEGLGTGELRVEVSDPKVKRMAMFVLILAALSAKPGPPATPAQ